MLSALWSLVEGTQPNTHRQVVPLVLVPSDDTSGGQGGGDCTFGWANHVTLPETPSLPGARNFVVHIFRVHGKEELYRAAFPQCTAKNTLGKKWFAMRFSHGARQTFLLSDGTLVYNR
jgi:hypothetical protein